MSDRNLELAVLYWLLEYMHSVMTIVNYWPIGNFEVFICIDTAIHISLDQGCHK